MTISTELTKEETDNLLKIAEAVLIIQKAHPFVFRIINKIPLTKRQAAEFLHISEKTFEQHIKSRKLAFYQLGRQKLFLIEDILEFLKTKRIRRRAF